MRYLSRIVELAGVLVPLEHCIVTLYELATISSILARALQKLGELSE